MTVTTRPRISDEGFTLAEVLVAIGIVMVVGMSVLGGVIGALSSQRAAEGHDVAVQVSVDRLEEVSQLEWDRLGFYEPTWTTTGQTGYTYTPYYPCGSTTACPAEPVALLSGTAPANPLHATTTMSGYKVHTYITWVMPAGETVYPVNQEGLRYASKRVRVVVEGTRAGKPFKETVETVIAPRVNQTPPPAVPIATTAPTAAPANSSSSSTIQPACPANVTAVGNPAVVEWDTVASGAVSYQILVNGTVRTTIPHDTYSRYSWTSLSYTTTTTYGVRPVSSAGVPTTCAPVTWTPPASNAPTPVLTCPSGVTVIKTPKVLRWNSVASGAGVTAYQVRVQGVVKATVAHDGRGTYEWTRTNTVSLKSTYEVRGVTPSGAPACPVVLYNPNA